MRLAPLPDPSPPGRGEVLVRTVRVGICGTDLHAYAGRQPMIRYPLVPGHELAVEVEAVGEPADRTSEAGLSPGDLCTVVPYLADGTCHACRRGLSNCCHALRVLGVHTDGGMRTRLLLPATTLLRATGLTPDEAGLSEMLAVGLHAVRRAGITDSDTVAVVGAGPIGLSCLAFASRMAKGVAAVDNDPDRLEAARRALGVTGFFPDGSLPERLAGHFGGQLPTVVIDATGSAAAMAASLQLTAHGASVVFVGHTGDDLSLSNPLIHQRELTIRASRNATREDFTGVLTALADGWLRVTEWITHRVSPEELPEALESWTRGLDRPTKAILEMA